MAKSGGSDFLRVVAESVLQLLMEAEVDGVTGAGRFEGSAERQVRAAGPGRNGHRDRTLETRLGPLNLKIPKLRTGSDFPGLPGLPGLLGLLGFLEPRKTVEKALVSVIRGRRGSPAYRPGAWARWCRRWG